MRLNLNATSAHILAKTPLVLTLGGLPNSFRTGMTGTNNVNALFPFPGQELVHFPAEKCYPPENL